MTAKKATATTKKAPPRKPAVKKAAPAKKAAPKKPVAKKAAKKVTTPPLEPKPRVPANKGVTAQVHSTPDLEAVLSQVAAMLAAASTRARAAGLWAENQSMIRLANSEVDLAKGIVAGKLAPTVAFIDLVFAGLEPPLEFWSTPAGRHAAATVGASKHLLGRGRLARHEAAVMLGVSDGTVAQLVARGVLPTDEPSGPARVTGRGRARGPILKASVLTRIGAQAGVVRRA